MRRKGGIHRLIQCALFCALIIIGAYIKIPIPPVPVTMQTAAVILAGICLGAKAGFASVFVYVFLGIAGLPVFSGGGGIVYITTPYFGYIIGFALAVVSAGKISEQNRFFLASVVSILIIYFCEVLWYIFICKIYLGEKIGIVDFATGFLIIPFIKDMIMCPFISVIAKKINIITK